MNWELKNFDIKYYTIDSWTFSSNMDKKNFNKTFILCSECEKKIIAGQKYMSEKLKTSLARMPLYILPHFLLENPLDKEDLDNFSDKIQKSFKIIKNYESIKEAKKELEQIKYYYKDKKLYFTLDMLFYKKQQQSTKIIKTIKDIDPEIIFEIEDSIQKVQKEEVFSNDRFNISLESFVYNLPIKQKENSPTNYRYILEIYEKIFLKIKINKKKMIQNFLRLLGAIHFGNHEFIGSTENTKIAEKIKSQNKLLLFLENMNLFEKEDKMNIEELGIKDENIKKYINTVGYDEQKTALFLLGYLMGEIGKKEAKGNDENKKPILNKLNYKGSDFKKIQKLYVTVFGKLKQEKILKYYEKLHGIIGFLINKNENTWNLNASENEYYILSGFGYSNMWKEKVDKKDENIIQEVK
ncbi:type I-B CRISPR-associated protein Cas8b/Csh1 [Oceanotoga sp. DSM 15011]|uniref:type I-B CRISPR-associated protein Cas8b/Csh1 n=1 Tax=Oceanotoga sp. DSM 15011 TaxID=2984951 RepID=UPI0021F4D543|nr:type I-B CRISPR-associated protein Cas8b/Csh1 [Oceanotoga sp. DSM 15011]UYP01351.1 type I-B CRISPR-associated protein Cas8b/Csh1 [Oceanotoga sp. DSM 15011]